MELDNSPRSDGHLHGVPAQKITSKNGELVMFSLVIRTSVSTPVLSPRTESYLSYTDERYRAPADHRGSGLSTLNKWTAELAHV